MERVKVIIVGGGASGLTIATSLSNGKEVLLLERGERVGRKLSATGNGQGNVGNENDGVIHYFSREKKKVESILSAYPKQKTLGFLKELGGCFLPDERGRIYPTSRQASSVTDLLRFRLEGQGTRVKTGCLVTGIERTERGFIVEWEQNGEKRQAESGVLVLCAGGKAAKNFGTDGNGYALAKSLSHSVTPTFPSLVQLKTDTKFIKPLKGIRVFCRATACVGGVEVASVQGDVIFTEYGVSGDAVFRLSAFLSDRLEENPELKLDLLPTVSQVELVEALSKKLKNPAFLNGELFCGILNNQVGRCVMKRAGEGKSAVEYAMQAKEFFLPVVGTLGYDYAQVTKGGVPLCEVDEQLQSKKVKGLYFAGEILDVDGECGGYNLQWAFSSAFAVAEAIKKETAWK